VRGRSAGGSRGFSLVEILVATGISLGLVAAFLGVLQRCRNDYAAQESLARVQDAARHALHLIATDIEHAGFFGFRPADAVQLASGLPSGARDCGGSFAVDLAQAVTGTDNGYRPPEDAVDCEPTATANGASTSADTLTLRHASSERTSPRAGRVQVYSSAMGSIPLMLFADGHAPGPVDQTHEVRDVEVRTFYIANSSVNRPGWPALRVKSLTESGGAAQFRDEEVMPGVEDLQVELRVASVDSGEVRFRPVAPGTALTPEERVVAIRVWLRVRADVTEPGYRDDRAWHYANTHFVPGVPESTQRRVLMERMVSLRNGF
jgi:Tfp pilus assembly protein PilW